MLQRMKKVFAILLVLVALVVVALAVALLIPSRSSVPVARTIPSPNGYETLLFASREVVGNPDGYSQMTEDELRVFISENSNALHIVRVALQQDSLVPWEMTLGYQSNHVVELPKFKMLTRLMAAEGRFAESEKRWMDAAGSYLAMLELGGTISRGGVIIDALVAVATETIALSELRVLTGSITNAADCRAICDRLSELDKDRPRWSEMAAFEEEWARQAYAGLQYRVAMIVTRKQTEASRKKTEEKYLLSQKRLREVMLEFATRAYELEQGARPASAVNLVPAYLKTVPLDPMTGQQLALPF
jgi:hypothetical protein